MNPSSSTGTFIRKTLKAAAAKARAQQDRRKLTRISANLPVWVQGMDRIARTTKRGILVDIAGDRARVEFETPPGIDFKPLEFSVDLREESILIPIERFENRESQRSMLLFGPKSAFNALHAHLQGAGNLKTIPDRRSGQRRSAKLQNDSERRRDSRRLSDLFGLEFQDDIEMVGKSPVLRRRKSEAYDLGTVRARREWLEQRLAVDLKALDSFCEPTERFEGNIENLIGVAHVPIGVAGPLRVEGQHAKGDFFVPMATTEGVLVNSYTLGMSLVSRSGGATVRILHDEMRISPAFIFDDIRQSMVFGRWAIANFQKIKHLAEDMTRHGKLLHIEPKVFGRQVVVVFSYDTKDAMGLNMICKATEHACKWMVSIAKPRRFFLRSNFSSNKKISAFNFQNPYGKSLLAEATIPKELLGVLKTSTELIVDYSQARLMGGIFSGMIGNNGHYANGLAAVFIACGQDVAHVANSHVGVSMFEATPNGDLYVCAQVPNLLVGTVGGGTGLRTSRASLDLMGCYGPGKSKKLAEILAATLLAGEISICVAITNGSYVDSHERFGRNRNK